MKKFFTLFAAMLTVWSADAFTPLSPAEGTFVPKAALRHFSEKALIMPAIAASASPAAAPAASAASTSAASPASPAATASGDFTISVNNITASTAFVRITPSNLTASYIWGLISAEEYNYIINGGYSDYGVTDLCSYFTFMINYYLAVYENLTFADFLDTGVISYAYNNLTANTDYVEIAIYMTESGCTGTGDSYAFSTLEDGPVVVTDTVSVHLLPYVSATTNGWNNQVATAGWWQAMGISADSAKYVSLSNNATTQLAGTYTTDDMDLAYTYIMDADYSADANYTFESITVVITEDANGTVHLNAEGVALNGIYYIMTFEPLNAPAALETVSPDRKAIKTIRDGQFIIIRDGVEYNALGATL